MRTLTTLICFAALAAAAPRPELLVSTDWLAQHGTDPKVVLLHVGRAKGAYDEGHIPGARFLSFGSVTLAMKDGVSNELPADADLKKAFEAVGVSDDSKVILYGEGSVLLATRAFFTLDYLGHGSSAALLDGGLEKWKAEGKSLAKDTPVVTAGNFTPRPRPELVVGFDGAKGLSAAASAGGKAATSLLDVRSGDEFKAGHIPGALNLPWGDSQVGKATPALLPQAELQKLYDKIGVSPDKPVVTYCNSGMQASQSYFTLKLLGYDVRMYDGSFSEWTAKGATVQK